MGLETETETETFRDIYRQFPATFAHFFVEIFFRDLIFQYRYRDFSNETKFFNTDTETETETETETFAFNW